MNLIEESTRRARSYRFADGLAEIGSGLLFVILSGPYLIWTLAPEGSRLARIAAGSRDVVLLGGLVLLALFVWLLKERSTYPRSGYVEEAKPGRRRITAAIILSIGLLVVAGLLLASLFFFPELRPGFVRGLFYLPVLLGLFLSLTMLTWGRTIPRFYVLAGVAFVTSVALGLNTLVSQAVHQFDWSRILSTNPFAVQPGEAELALQSLARFVYRGTAILLAVFGLAMLVSGLIVRSKYLRENPLPVSREKEQI